MAAQYPEQLLTDSAAAAAALTKHQAILAAAAGVSMAQHPRRSNSMVQQKQ